jgi:transcriptional regulator with XRE-family HTH domain
MTQEQVAEESKSKLSAAWLSNVEKGKVNPTRQTVKNIAEGIGVSISRIESLAEALEEISERQEERKRERERGG